MSADPILRPEFELYVKMNAESNDRTSKALDQMVSDNKIMHERVFEQMLKHDRIEERVNNNSDDIRELSEAVTANSKLTSIANKIIWGGGIVLAGALGTFGKDVATWLMS